MARTTHRSSTGRKLLAVRTKAGKFADIQTHKRASAADQRLRSKAEGIWVRWGLYRNDDVALGMCSTRAEARAWADEVRTWHKDARVVRIEIHAGVPDPLRRRE